MGKLNIKFKVVLYVFIAFGLFSVGLSLDAEKVVLYKSFNLLDFVVIVSYLFLWGGLRIHKDSWK